MMTPLFSVYREDIEELRVFGDVFIDVGIRGVYHASETIGRYPARSTLKPFQFLATGNAIPTKGKQATGKQAIEKHACGNPAGRNRNNGSPARGHPTDDRRARLAACVGSPVATLEQIENLIDWYGGENWEKRVKSPAGWPIDNDAKCMLKDRGDSSPLFGMCFSKHMGILEACHREKWDEKSYLKTTHPYHARLHGLLKKILSPTSPWDWVIDGCGLSTPVLTLRELAKLYRWLGTTSEKTASQVRELYFDFPDWIGGPLASDSEILRNNPNRVVAKVGADGLLCLAIPATRKFPDGAGVAIKLSSGFDHKFFLTAAQPILKSLGLKGKMPEFTGQDVRFHFVPFARRKSWLDISPLNQEGSAVFPGDTPYHRKLLLDTSKGQHLTLSAIETTVHVGAHADAPNHYSNDPRGIDSVEVDSYLGPCQVIQVARNVGTLQPSDVHGQRIDAIRILFRTDTFLDSNRWKDNFATLSKALIEYLGDQGVVLVGIDTPSIDPSKSRELPAHRATLRFNMRILEGLDLRKIEPGVYELFAAPLRLAGADASPVRALLRKAP